MFSVAPLSDRDNPYIKLLVAAMPPNVTVRFYDKWAAVFGRYDVFHMHWPEHLLRGGGKLKVWARRAVFASLLLRWQLSKTAVVRTVHNANPHERSESRTEAFLLAWLDQCTTSWIVMNRQTHIDTTRPVDVIPHGHYRDWYRAEEQAQPIPGRVLHFGVIRPYKNVPQLIGAFRGMRDEGLSLHVAGDCSDSGLAAAIRDAAGGDRRVTLSLSHQSDADLVRELGQCSLVVLPYSHFLNSGALLLALSLNRPVLVPNGPATEAYVEEFGSDWVMTYRSEISAADIGDALENVSNRRPGIAVAMATRNWDEIAIRTSRVYDGAAGCAGSSSARGGRS
jgi:beta-1,4-mannosyltransferase